MKKDYRDVPIPEVTLLWTGKPAGDDEGYRDVRVCQEDATNPDPLVQLSSAILSHVVYAEGASPCVCVQYPEGLGAPNTVLVREPVNRGLVVADAILKSYGRRLLVLDGFRSAEVQRRLWEYIFLGIIGNLPLTDLTVPDCIRIGIQADDIGAYAALARTDQLADEIEAVKEKFGEILGKVAEALSKSVDELALLFITFRRGLNLNTFPLDDTSNTAHGGGGAVDAILIDTTIGRPTFLGVPFDFVGAASALTYFEHKENLEPYQRAVQTDPVLKEFAAQFGITEVSRDDFNQIRDERRLFFHIMSLVNATYYVSECWHWNLGNERRGRQFDAYPCSGNACHAILMNTRDMNGDVVAVWGNAYAQKEAARLLAK